MSNNDFVDLAKACVVTYYNNHIDRTDAGKEITEENVYVVWLVKVLQNNKALLSTDVVDGAYYEITYNGDKDEVYLDVYKKWENVKITHEGE